MNLISDFIEDSAKSTTPVADLLEKARTVADLIDDKDFVIFCEKELNGYAENETLPDYRQVNGVLDIWYDGPLLKAEDKRTAVGNPIIVHCWNPIKDISSVVASGKDYVSPVQNDEEFYGYKNRTVIKLYFLQRIENEVRRKINEWKSLKLKEGKFPLESENKSSVIINGPVNGSNIVASMNNSSATINNNTNIDFNALKQLVSKIESDLENAKDAESEKMAALKEQVASLKQSIELQNETSAVEILKNIAAGAISSGIWSIGSSVSAFLGSLM